MTFYFKFSSATELNISPWTKRLHSRPKYKTNRCITRLDVRQYWVRNDTSCSLVRYPSVQRSFPRLNVECAAQPFEWPTTIPIDNFCRGTALPGSSWNCAGTTRDRQTHFCATMPLRCRFRRDRTLRRNTDCPPMRTKRRSPAFWENTKIIIIGKCRNRANRRIKVVH